MQDVKIENFGFVILCPERNYGGLKATARSIKGNFHNHPYICVTTSHVHQSEFDEFNEVCQTFIGGNKYTSLINKGIQESKSEWIYFIMAGQHVSNGQMNRYNTFCKNKKTIMFPIVDKMWMFHESSLNGLLLNRQVTKDAGYFDEDEEDFQNARLMWAVNAIDKGYQFRALVGVPR